MIYLTLLNIAIFQGIILGLIILKSSLFNSQSNKYLTYAIFTLSILLLNLVLDLGGAYHTWPFLQLIDNVEWTFLLPVFLFLFIYYRIKPALTYSKIKINLLFVPFGYSVFLALFCDTNALVSLATIPLFSSNVVELLIDIEGVLAITFIPLLPLYSYRLLKYSKEEQERKWLKALWIIFALLIYGVILTLMIALFFQYDVTQIMKSLALFGTFLIHWITYLGIFKFKLANDKAAILNFLNAKTLDQIPQIANVPIKEGNKEPMTSDNLYFQQLELLCKEEHIYTDSALTREMIAERLGISVGYVSQIVNTITQDNFTNYINTYRVEAIKQMIVNPEFKNYKVLTIGLEAGFTSKTTFYTAFKKLTGLTPNEYRNRYK